MKFAAVMLKLFIKYILARCPYKFDIIFIPFIKISKKFLKFTFPLYDVVKSSPNNSNTNPQANDQKVTINSPNTDICTQNMVGRKGFNLFTM